MLADRSDMTRIYEKAYFRDQLISVQDAQVSVASSAVLYGLSVYTVFLVCIGRSGEKYAFRIDDHYRRLANSARIIGIDTFESSWPWERFVNAMRALVQANGAKEDVLVRASVHVTDLLPGTRSRGLETVLSAFMYEAIPILPQHGARLKTSVWRRIPDYAIPSRAKVNGAYVNSVLAKQDAIDSGYDDCILLDVSGHVCELSAANIFIVRDGVLITPNITSDLLEGISRKTVLQMADEADIPAEERNIDMTELYIADEVFACGTSAYIAPVVEVDARPIGSGAVGSITTAVREMYTRILHDAESRYRRHLTPMS
jgi:branched-chain amino acid aminotransferase